MLNANLFTITESAEACAKAAAAKRAKKAQAPKQLWVAGLSESETERWLLTMEVMAVRSMHEIALSKIPS